MALFRPTYRDQKTGKQRESTIWWYEFTFAGRRIRESAKTGRKTLATAAEKNRHLELERAYNGVEDTRNKRIRTIAEMADEFLTDYKLRNPRSVTYATYAVSKLKEHLGKSLSFDIGEAAVRQYQATRLESKAAPKTINEEVGFLLRILGEQGDLIRLRLRKQKALKLRIRTQISRAFTDEEKKQLLDEAKKRRSPHIYPALMLALHAGLRDAEIRTLQWGRVDLQRAIVQVGDSKTDAGTGRTVPMNEELREAMTAHASWYLEKFDQTRPEWYVFPFGKPQPTDPTKPLQTLKGSWSLVRKATGIEGRWHDSRHTFVTDLAESGEASDETIRDIAGHVSKQMLKHYSHIRMEAKRRAVGSLTKKAPAAESTPVSNGVLQESPKVTEIDGGIVV